MKSLRRHHPITAFVYYCGVITVAMLSNSPIMIGIGYFCAILMAFCVLGGVKATKLISICLAIVGLIALTNPLFVRKGSKILLYVMGNPYTQEAFLYGLNVGFQLTGIFIWLKCFNTVVTDDKLIYIYAKKAPKIALLLSMSMSSIPLLVRQYRKIDDSQKALGIYSTKSIIRLIKNKLLVVQILFNWAIENSLVRAESMKARGYGLKGRTTMNIYRNSNPEIAYTIIMGLLFVANAFIAVIGIDELNFYPSIGSIDLSTVAVIGYCLTAFLYALGIVGEIKEVIVWRWLKSKI